MSLKANEMNLANSAFTAGQIIWPLQSIKLQTMNILHVGI